MVSIPKWPNPDGQMVDASECFLNCLHVNSAWTYDEDELTPENVTPHADCVRGCGPDLRAKFPVSWGGTKE